MRKENNSNYISSELIEVEKTNNIQFNIKDYYITNTGCFFNIYTIDNDGVLWGAGWNKYGQLGQGYRDDEMHYEKVKIAENVIHVDIGVNGSYVIFLTDDHKLYGCGTSAKGELLTQYENSFVDRHGNEIFYTENTPKLLMENVQYAVCGKNDVVCLLDDNSVWTWGTVYYEGVPGSDNGKFEYIEEPLKILDKAIYITGGPFNHAALCEDGTLWTWGYNYAGNCGISDKELLSRPTYVTDNVQMVWTNRMSVNIKENEIEELNQNTIINDLTEQTVIEKKDGTYWICGLNVGTTKKTIEIYFEVENEEIICSSEFMSYSK